MFSKLFGGGSKGNQPAAQAKPAPMDPTATIEKLESQCETIRKRIIVTENKVKDAKANALAKKKARDQRGAVLALK